MSDDLNKRGISLKLLRDIKDGMDRLEYKGLAYSTLIDETCGCALGTAIIGRAIPDSVIHWDVERLIQFIVSDDTGDHDSSIYSEQGSRFIFARNDTDAREPQEDRYTRMYAVVESELANV